MGDKTEWNAFNATFNNILSTLIPDKPIEELADAYKWLKKVIIYNVPHGKRNRGLAVVETVKLIAEHNNKRVSEEELELARVLGWTVEFLQAYFLIVDDMMDQSITRRGQPCWYKLDEVGLISCNDAILLDQENYHILNIYFSDKKYYVKLLDLMHQISRFTAYGQQIDTASNPPNKGPQFQMFSKLRLESVYKYKTAFYSFVLPVRLALYMSDINSEEQHKKAEQILLRIGHLFQAQDDYLDCWGDPAIIGKIGTDVEEGKCCWPVVTAFSLCNEKQRKIIEENYGKKDSDCVQRVKEVYNELKLKEVFKSEETDIYNNICQSIDNLKNESQLNPQIFQQFLDKIYKRNK